MPKPMISKENLIGLYKKYTPILKNHNIDLILFYGSLLGYVRENDLLNEDDDIDFLVSRSQYESLIECLKKVDNCIVKIFEDQITIYDYEYGSGPYDICIYDDYDKDILIKWDSNSLYSKEDIYPLKSIKFHDIDIFIPKDSKEILRQTYGDDYMIPRPKNKDYNWLEITKVRFKPIL